MIGVDVGVLNKDKALNHVVGRPEAVVQLLEHYFIDLNP